MNTYLQGVCKKPGPVFTKAFQNQDQDQAKVKYYFTTDFL